MSKHVSYSCDICREQIESEDLSDSFGVHFSTMKRFTLGGYGSTEGQHICIECAVQLKKHLNNEQITRMLKAYEDRANSTQQHQPVTRGGVIE